MSGTVKDALIMAGAAGSIGLLVVGAELGAPIVAGAAAGLALGAAVVKIATSHIDANADQQAKPEPQRVAAIR